MVSLPLEFIPIRYDGYYLNIVTMNLFSLKQSGTLRELKHRKSSKFRYKSGYTVSVRGNSYSISDEYLQRVKDQHLLIPRNVEIKITHTYEN